MKHKKRCYYVTAKHCIKNEEKECFALNQRNKLNAFIYDKLDKEMTIIITKGWEK